MSDPLIITVAPNGAYKQRQQHPALPLAAPEIAQEAARCLKAGAAMLHLHVREEDGRHSLDPALYRQAIAAVRAEVGDELVIQVTTEAARRYQPQEQIALARQLEPEALSVGLREIDHPSVGEPGLSDFFNHLKRQAVMTQVILYDTTDLVRWQHLRSAGVVPEAPWFLLFVLGRYSADQVSSPRELLPFVQAHQGKEPWAMCAFGAAEHACAAAAAALGGHVRVGFENNLRLRTGEVAPHNAALVAQAAELAACLGRPLARAADVRKMFSER